MKTLAACVVVGTLAAGAASAGSGNWTSDGPWGGTVHVLEVNPASPNVIFASTRGGIFRSDDGGVSWVRKQAGMTGRIEIRHSFAMDRQLPSTLWAVDTFGRVNRTTDSGENWAQTGAVLPTPNVKGLLDAPGSTGRLYVLPWGTPGILASTDNGNNFSPLPSTGLPNKQIGMLAIDPTNPLRLVAGTTIDYDLDPAHPQTLFLSTNGGTSWTGVLTLGTSPGEYHGEVTSIRFGAGNEVYAAVDGLLYRSNDKGASWTGPLNGAGYGIAWAEPDPGSPGTVLIGGNSGMKRSTDGGVSATAINGGLDVTPGAVAAIRTIRLHPSYPTIPDLWIGTEEAGMYFSSDGGANWFASNDGLAGTNIRGLAMFHNASTHRLFAGYGDPAWPSPALFRGNAPGPGGPFSWAPGNNGLRAYQIRALAIDPTTTSGGIGTTRIYAAGRAAFPGATPGIRSGGLYRSVNGGSTWHSIDSGLPLANDGQAFLSTVRSLVLDPRSCASPPTSGPCTSGPLQTLYATSTGRSIPPLNDIQFRVLKSIDGGNSWTSADAGIPQPISSGPGVQQQLLVVPIVINPANPQELFVGALASWYGLSTPPTIASGVFRSTDGGATWGHRSNGLPRYPGSTDTVLDVLSLAINPVNPLEIWCSVINLATDSDQGGIYHTVDGGLNWTNSSTGLASVDIRAIAVDASNPSVLYASGGGTDANPGNIYKSIDSGATWNSISVGLPADAALALLVDPVEPSVLYAGTTSGLWSLTQVPDDDADGIPDTIEMAAPNAGDGNGNGLSDHLESNVGSLTSATGGGAERLPGSARYFTVAITPVSGTCSQAVDVQSVYAAYHGADRAGDGDLHAYPHQLARFEILDCEKASVTIKFHGGQFGGSDSMRFYGPSTPGDPETIGWHDFSAHAVRIAQDSWRLTLENGQFGSYRPASAHSILFEGGPAWKAGMFRDGFD